VKEAKILVRDFEVDDLKKLRELSERLDFPTPDVESKLYYAKATVVLGDKIIGIGLARVTSEFVMFLDPDEPKRFRAKSLELLFRLGVMSTVKVGIDEAHVFVYNRPYAEILKKKFGFVDRKGIPLYLEL